MKAIKKRLSSMALLAVVILPGCKKDDPVAPSGPAAATYTSGVFITNEGPFGSGTGTLSFYDRSTAAVSNDIFEAYNGYPLGNIVQSMQIYNGAAYIVVNNAGKVEVANGTTLASAGTISGFTYPRNFLGITGSKGYVTEWGAGGAAGAVKIVNLGSKVITGTIATGNGAEGMVLAGSNVYVACGGGFVNDSVVTVINSGTDAVVTNIVVGANPKSIQVDALGKIWVLCAGQWDPTYSFLEKTGRLVRIDPATNAVDLSLSFSSAFSQPSGLVINSSKTDLYYSYSGGVYTQPVTLLALTGSPVISRNFYGLGIDPATGDIYGSDAGNFTSNGKVIHYSPALTVVDSFTVGVIPGNFCFK